MMRVGVILIIVLYILIINYCEITVRIAVDMSDLVQTGSSPLPLKHLSPTGSMQALSQISQNQC